jgi:hypothetical protein
MNSRLTPTGVSIVLLGAMGDGRFCGLVLVFHNVILPDMVFMIPSQTTP